MEIEKTVLLKLFKVDNTFYVRLGNCIFGVTEKTAMAIQKREGLEIISKKNIEEIRK